MKMNKSLFHISQMDCPTEEQLIRMKLRQFDEIQSLEFDIPERKLTVLHKGSAEQIFSALETLHLRTTLLSTETSEGPAETEANNNQRKVIWAVLMINFFFFGLEMLFGILSNSMGLIADSLDMLADSFVYALALFAIGGSMIRKNNIARMTGYFQLLLALTGIIEVIRRFVGFERMPDFRTMIVISVLALIANAISLYLLQKDKSKEVHIKAIMICTSNDVIINAGVITAGFLVNWLQSGYPDLIIGAIVFVIVARGAYRILKMAG
jgi:Co/Zn/Cd efflux system component